MVNIFKRMRRLRSRLLDIRIGPGAALLSNDVKRIHMRFAKKINDGHMGPRKFWHECLPRLKYHNPAVPMTVKVTDEQTGPATLSVFFAAPSASQPSAATAEHGTHDSPPADAPAPEAAASVARPPDDAPRPGETLATIDMKHKTDAGILEELLALTRAQVLEPTAAEEEEMRVLREEQRRAKHDRERQAAYLAKQKREAEVLAQARRSLDA